MQRCDFNLGIGEMLWLGLLAAESPGLPPSQHAFRRLVHLVDLILDATV